VHDSLQYSEIECNGKNATFGAIDMIQKQDIDVIIGPGCGAGKRNYISQNKIL